jgi:hypothetical protein
MSKEREVSGKIISTDDACNWNLTVGALKDYDHVYVNGIRYVEFQPEQTEQEPVAWMQDDIELYVQEEKDIVRGYIIPLYTAPPKRESLSEDEIFDIGYKAGFAIDQDDEVDNYGFLNGDGYVDNEPYFKLVRAIEKAHGIGVDNE